MPTKICTQCKVEKDISEFYNRSSRCKNCVLKLRKEHYKKNSEQKKEYAKQYRKQNPEYYKNYLKKYRSSHKDIRNEKDRLARQTHPEVRILNNLRSRLWQITTKQYIQKADHTINLVGCSPKELKRHIESKFQDGMTWGNQGRGGWHIDHIRQIAEFDLNNPEHQRRCFNYKNLQPMWESDNCSKNKHKIEVGV